MQGCSNGRHPDIFSSLVVTFWENILSVNKLSTFKDSLTFSCCVFTSSRYRYRCQWERNQSLNVCVSQSSRSVWVPSHGQLCSFSLAPRTASAQLLVNSSACFFFSSLKKPLPSVTDANHSFFFYSLFHWLVSSLFEGMMLIHEQIVFMDQSTVVMCSYWPGQEWL